MPRREYCCCAIPIVNGGIYSVLTEQTVLGILVGTLSVATPTIVGASTPTFAKSITAIISYAIAALQLLGFIGVHWEKPITFRRYLTLHGFATVAIFSVSAAWIILSGTRHSTAQTKCEADFYNATPANVSTEGQTLCNIFSWMDIGLMAGLWVILAIMQGYMFYVASVYSKAQDDDYLRFRTAEMTPPNDDIPMITRDLPIDYRGHRQKDSNASNASTDQLYPRQRSNPLYPGNAYVKEQPQSTPYDNGYHSPDSWATSRTPQPPHAEGPSTEESRA